MEILSVLVQNVLKKVVRSDVCVQGEISVLVLLNPKMKWLTEGRLSICEHGGTQDQN